MMTQKVGTKEVVDIEGLSKSTMVQIEALLRLLVKKDVITVREYIDEMQELRQEVAKEKGTME